MTPSAPPPLVPGWRRWLASPLLHRAVGLLLVVGLLTWPLVLDPMGSLSGFPNVDSQDTVMLRGLVADLLTHPWDAPRSQAIYYPVGFPILHLTPNLLDHLSMAPLVWLLPFPLADNLWWVLVLLGNGLAAHHLGRVVGGTESSGWLAALGFLSAEALLREANLSHAPQSLMLFAPLYVAALVALWRAPDHPRATRRAALAGLWLALSALAYWYYGLFLVLGTLPFLLKLRLRQLAAGAAVLLLLCGPGLLPQLMLWDDLPLTSGRLMPAPARADDSFSALPGAEVFVAQHGNDLLFWLRRVPLDLSNRLSLVLVAAAIWGSRRLEPGLAWRLAFPVLLGGVMVLGPYLRSGDGLWVVGDSVIALPFQWMRDLHPFLARLTWAERFGMLLPLGLVALAARAPRAGWLAVAVLVENVVLSGNAPLLTTSVQHQRCWAALPPGDRAMVVLPFRRAGLRAPRVGVQARFHGRPLINPVLLPPGAQTPSEWNAWVETQPMMRYLTAYEDGSWPEDPGPDAVRQFRDAGVGVIAIDVEPGGPLTGGGINRYRAGMTRHLGDPIDLGCALVWWLDPDVGPPAPLADGEAWRQSAADWKAAHPAPSLDTLIQPVWDSIQAQKPTAPQERP